MKPKRTYTILDKIIIIAGLICFGFLVISATLISYIVYLNASSNSQRIPFGATMHQKKPVEWDIIGREGDVTIVEGRTVEPGKKTSMTQDTIPKEITSKTLIASPDRQLVLALLFFSRFQPKFFLKDHS